MSVHNKCSREFGIIARAAAAELTRRKCFSRQNPPPHVGGSFLEHTLKAVAKDR